MDNQSPNQPPPINPAPPKDQVYNAPKPTSNHPHGHHFIPSKLMILLLFILLVIAGASGIYLSNSKSKPQPTPKPTPTVNPLPTPTDETANWKTYENTKYGYTIKLPPNWSMKAATEDPLGETCSAVNGTENILELSKNSIKECGFIGEMLPPQDIDITIWVTSAFQDIYSILSNPGKITIGGIEATRYKFKDNAEFPNVQDTRIYLNHNNKGYIIYLREDSGGNFLDLIYNQILSTFKFTDSSPTPTCIPRPACLDATPRCLLDIKGMCPPVSKTPKACTQEAKVCPDGSAVVRQGPNCEFAPCPQ